MRILSLSEASIEKRTSTLKFARSPCTDPPGAPLTGPRSLEVVGTSIGISTGGASASSALSEMDPLEAASGVDIPEDPNAFFRTQSNPLYYSHITSRESCPEPG